MPKNKFYVTTPLYYANAKPHIGTLYSTVLADVAARWQKLCGKNTFLLTGTDEHGQKMQQKAENFDLNPQEFVDSMAPIFKTMWNKFEISYDKFIQTTHQEHKRGITTFLQKLIEQGDIYKADYTGLYCVPCESFVTDEKITQCSMCSRSLMSVKEENYFFRLSSFEERLLAFYQEYPDFIAPKERLNEVKAFVKSGLKDLSISRKNVQWGIPFFNDPEHTVYVWVDALAGYITGLGYGQDVTDKTNFRYWWPVDVHVMGKDIVRFHAVYWPAFLMSAGLSLPKKLLVHGYILCDDEKMSKSKGNIIDPEELLNTYGIEQIRYYLVRHIAVNHDGYFSRTDLERCITSDLANTIGNLLQRTSVLARKNNLSVVKPVKIWKAKSAHIHEKCGQIFKNFSDDMNHYQYHPALAGVISFMHEVNAYFQEHQPWVLAKKNSELFAEVISVSCHSLYAVALMLWPVMPKKMEYLLMNLGYQIEQNVNYAEILRKNHWNKTFHLTALNDEPLFSRPEKVTRCDATQKKKENKKMLAQQENKIETSDVSAIDIGDVAKVHIAVGTILSCHTVVGSDKLYKLRVEIGCYGTRTILAGVTKYFTPEQLIGSQGVFVVNLKPRKMMGIESQGMMLFAKDNDNNFEMITVTNQVANGTRLG